MIHTLKNFLFAFLSVFMILSLSSCGSDDNGSDGAGPGGGFGNFRGGQPTSVEATPVLRADISRQVQAYGTVRPQDVVAITPQVSNRVTNILVDLGDNVARGQVMAEIYDVPFREAVEQARAQIRQAEASFERDSTQLERQRELFERDLISRSEFDDIRATFLNSKAQYESSKAALSQSMENLENTKITSPVNGVVLSRNIAEGDVATTGQAAFEVANLVGFETRVFLPLQDWEQVQVGQQVTMSLSSRGSEIAEGVVSRKSAQLDETTGLGEVVISLTESRGSVYQGALLQSRIILETRENTIVIPRSALVEKVDTYIEPETGTIELERSYSAFVVQGDTVAARRELDLGIEQGDRIEILSGLNEGDQLIITGQNSLEDGRPVQVAGSRPGGQASQQAINTNEGQRAENLTEEERQEIREDTTGMSPQERREYMQERRENSGESNGNRQGRGNRQQGNNN
jgi:RND family efflux transporter MFP subunit